MIQKKKLPDKRVRCTHCGAKLYSKEFVTINKDKCTGYCMTCANAPKGSLRDYWNRNAGSHGTLGN